MIVRRSTRAAKDLDRIARFIERDDPDAALRVTRKVFDDCVAIGNFPECGRPGHRKNTRELIISVLPYTVIYKVEAEVIVILHIFHGAQDWQ